MSSLNKKGVALTRRTFLLGSLALLACSQAPTSHTNSLLPSGSYVIALGDSLTAGYGASMGADYPHVLAEMTQWNVHNAGISGNTSADVLNRLPEVLQKTPQLILLGIGGNDFLHKIPLADTRYNMTKIIQTIQNKDIPLVLIAEPKPSISAAVFGQLSDHPLYNELAKAHQLPLLSSAWATVLSDESLRSDAIHANDEGYRQFAKILVDYLQKEGFLR